VSTATEEIEAAGKTGEYKYPDLIKDRSPYLPILSWVGKILSWVGTL
jgi:hypothetical protein